MLNQKVFSHDDTKQSRMKYILQKYRDPIYCPVCYLVFAEWEKVDGSATIKKWCPRCKEYKFISKKT